MTSRRARAAGSLTLLALAGAYARRRRSPARRNWSPPDGRHVMTSTLAVRINGGDGPPIVLLHEPESRFQIQPDMAAALRNPASDE